MAGFMRSGPFQKVWVIRRTKTVDNALYRNLSTIAHHVWKRTLAWNDFRMPRRTRILESPKAASLCTVKGRLSRTSYLISSALWNGANEHENRCCCGVAKEKKGTNEGYWVYIIRSLG